jgi:hypothetical protein
MSIETNPIPRIKGNPIADIGIEHKTDPAAMLINQRLASRYKKEKGDNNDDFFLSDMLWSEMNAD